MGLFRNGTPGPPITEKDVPDQDGKVFMITGSTSGIGKALAGLLYSRNAKVYIAARSAEKARQAMYDIKGQYQHSRGSLVFLKLNLDDLASIKASVKEFLSKEDKLDILWNNAAVMVPPQGSLTKQNHELQLGTNCLGPFLFTKLLAPVMARTAESALEGSVRVVWVSSAAAERHAPDGGVEMDNLDYQIERSAWEKYGASKAGNILYAFEYAQRFHADRIVSVSVDPGNSKTELFRHASKWQKSLRKLALKDPILGAYTELYAGLSRDINLKNSGLWIEPGGHIKQHNRIDIIESCKMNLDGGSGVSEQFWEWSENHVRAFA